MLVRALYTVVLALVSPLLLLGLYKRKANKPPFGSRWKEHFGITPKLSDASRAPIWIHAVSVGESLAAVPLINALKNAKPHTPIVVTTTTSTGAEQIAKLGDLVEHRYMPIDFAFAVRGFLSSVRPSRMLIIETELWPNTLATVHKAEIPITVVNARLSEKSRSNYAKISPLFNVIHPCLSQVLCQSQADAERFASLGVAADKLIVTGSIKFDLNIADDVKAHGEELRKELGLTRPVWIAASTHKGEDEQILAAHRELLISYPSALLVIVPRHPERFDSVFELAKQGFETIRRTNNDPVTNSCQVYLADTMGEMLVLMSAADICFVAGSLIGDKVGGHNVLEPAALEIPTITGPSYFNFKEITDELITEQGIWVKPSGEIAKALQTLIEQPSVRKPLIEGATNVVKRNQGSLQRTLNAILGLNK